MKLAGIISKIFFYIALISGIAVFASIIYLNGNINREYKVKKGNALEIDAFIPLSVVYENAELSSKNLSKVGAKYDVDLKIFGIIPFSTVNVEVVDEMHVSVLGLPFGMKLYTDGVLVTEASTVKTEGGSTNPAAEAGIKKGDYIISVNGTHIYTNEELSRIVESSDGDPMTFLIKRNGKEKRLIVRAALSEETDSYKIGIWVRDSSAGIGTLTFYSPATNVVCGLGHGICDEATETLLEVNSGKLVNAEIISVEMGKKGNPGQLKGKFGFKALGDIDLNCQNGVYSLLDGSIDTSNIKEVALKQEIQNGKAKLYCTVDGTEPTYFDCEIEIRTAAFLSKTQNMLVTVTDKRLLEKTGGIVQGMSGAPIIQNGKLIGAVTHVLVDDPARGYAVFAENMLKTAQEVAEKQLKAVS